VVEEATIASVGDNRACSDGRSGENECGGSKGSRGKSGTEYEKGPLCYGGRLWEELLCMWVFWAYGPTL